MYQPDVTCGHFWKGSFGGGYKIRMFFREARLSRMIGKTTIETDFTSYLFPSAKMGIAFHFLGKFNQILLSILALWPYLCCIKNDRVDGRKINTSLPLNYKCKLIFPKKRIWFF